MNSSSLAQSFDCFLFCKKINTKNQISYPVYKLYSINFIRSLQSNSILTHSPRKSLAFSFLKLGVLLRQDGYQKISENSRTEKFFRKEESIVFPSLDSFLKSFRRDPENFIPLASTYIL